MLLCDAQIQNTRKVAMESNTGEVLDIGSLYQRFARLHDKRKAKGKRYALATILVSIFLAKLCGEDKPSGIAEWVALRGEWIAQVLGLKRKNMPSHPIYRLTFAHNMAIINNLVLASIGRSDFPFVPSARRFFAARPDHALHLLL
jgi:DDE family transposase